MSESFADLGALVTLFSSAPVAAPVSALPAGVVAAAGRYFHHATPIPISSTSAATKGHSHFFPLAGGARPAGVNFQSIQIFQQLLRALIALTPDPSPAALATMGSSLFGIAGFTLLTGGGSSRRSAANTSAVEPPPKGGFPVAIS